MDAGPPGHLRGAAGPDGHGPEAIVTVGQRCGLRELLRGISAPMGHLRAFGFVCTGGGNDPALDVAARGVEQCFGLRLRARVVSTLALLLRQSGSEKNAEAEDAILASGVLLAELWPDGEGGQRSCLARDTRKPCGSSSTARR